MSSKAFSGFVLTFACGVSISASAQSGSLPAASPAQRAQARDIFKQLIEINTTDTPKGSVTAAAKAMQKRFLDAGFAAEDMHLLGPDPNKMNLIVRMRAASPSSEKPVLFLGHLDVVEALPSDWHTNPFEFVEKDGYFYGRGTQDIKSGDAILITTFIRMKKEGYKPDRDLILALTADEEGGKSNGVDWLIKNHRDLIDAEYVLNDDHGWLISEHGKPAIMEVAPPKSSMPTSSSNLTIPADTALCPCPTTPSTISPMPWAASSAMNSR